MGIRATGSALLTAGCLLLVAIPTAAQEAQEDEDCVQAVVFAVPGVTWEDVRRAAPESLLDAVAAGAAGSMSVRTNSARTDYASGFATLGAGTRMDVPSGAGVAVTEALPSASRFGPARVEFVDAIEELADIQGYRVAEPGALGSALAEDDRVIAAVGNSALVAGDSTVVAGSFGSFALLATMDSSGATAAAATSSALLEEDTGAPFGVRTDAGAATGALTSALESCWSVVVDPGDLIRADQATAAGEPIGLVDAALQSADGLLAEVRARLGPEDLLLVVSPTSPARDDDVHFGVAVAEGPGFEAGSGLSSSSTRRDGMVSLVDVAPTVLDHLGVARPASMLGRPMFAVRVQGDRVAGAVDLDRESVFIDRARAPVSTGFVLFQVALYLLTIWLLARRERRGPQAVGDTVRNLLQLGALLLAAFPVSTFLAGAIQGHALGGPLYGALLLAIDAAIVAVIALLASEPLDRLLGVVALTLTVLLVDLVIGAPLQLNTVFSYSPIVAGRFAGIGNTGFAVLAATSVLTGSLAVHRWRESRLALVLVGALFAVTVLIDGAPAYGSDVGGALALVPGLGVAWLLLAGRHPTWKTLLVAIAAGVAVLGGFLLLDLTRPAEQQTHLARLFEDVQSGGGEVFADAIGRKVRTNLRVFRSTIWTFVIPAALGILAWLLFRPRGRWERIARAFPQVRAGLIGGGVLAVLGFSVNDSGVVIPAMMCAYLVPVALVVYLSMGSTEAPE